MVFRKCYANCLIACLGLLFYPQLSGNQARAKDFVVVIDPGHGGQDPGAVGKISKEKNINLAVALKLGRLIQTQHDDVRVIYTRNTDIFIPLGRRAEIANDAKADLFISIHTNAIAGKKPVRGASTWTLGLARSEANLDVAKRENSVILYEDDYQMRYAGFDPRSSESYIIFEFMQDKYMLQSVRLASLIQKQFGQKCQRKDLGVHQAGFLVLKASAMPSVLVELGFISTSDEERYLNSSSGTSTLAQGIYAAFASYKRETHIASLPGSAPARAPLPAKINTPSVSSPEEESPTPQHGGKTIFKVQLLTSPRVLTKKDRRLKGIKGVEYYKENGLYKYTCGASENYQQVLKTSRAMAGRFKDSFIIAFKNGKRTDVNAAIDEYKRKR